FQRVVMNNEVLGERAQNAEGAATEEQSRLKQYKNLAKHEASCRRHFVFQDMRRRRTECSVELRKQKRDDLLMKRRNLVEEDEEDELNVSEDGSKQQPEGGNKKPPAPVLTCDQVVEILKNNPDVQQTRDAFESVRRLLSKSKNPPVDEVINCGLIHALVQGLSIPDEKIPYECAWALTNIVSGTSEQTVKAVESGATGPLIQLMMHADLNLAEQATWAVANIAGDSAQLRDFVIQSSGVEALMVLCSKMGQLTTSFVRTLAWTFSNMCRHKNPHAPLPVLQVLAQGLLRLMQHEDYNVRQDACWAVSYLTDGPDEQITLARDAGIMPFVYKHLSEDDGLVAPALRVLGNMATGNDVLTQTVIELGTLRVLPAVARKAKSSSIVKECCWLISNVIAGVPPARWDPSCSWTVWTAEAMAQKRRTQQQIQAVIDAGLLTMLVTIMQTGDYRCQFECSWALANLAQGGTTRQILELTGEKPMAALAVALGHTNADLLSNILEVIYSLLTAVATNKPDKLDALKEEVEEAGVLDKLEALQENHNEKVYNQTYKILSEYFSEEDENEENDGETGNFYNF
ncbi:ima-2, partial [Pristionchus pacificus]|uniref:Importin subunit alpha n=1 Tax=Pristionchus pacificus TaxID=54126 RepID=A0A2A6BMB6_PRIPA